MMFEGIIVPVFTEFSPDGSTPVLDNIPEYARYLATNGVKAILVNGTSGEGMSMTTEERMRVAEAWLKAGHEQNLHVQVQVGGTNFCDVLRLAKHAEANKADSLLTLPELYFKPQSTSALVEYLKAISSAAPNTHLLYYHIPSYSSVNVNIVEVIQEAGKAIPTFRGIKYTDADLNIGQACANLNPEKYRVFLGCDTVMTGAYLLGFKSCTATSVNLFPSLCLEIFESVKVAKLARAQQLQKKLNEAIDVITKYGPWVPSNKAAFEIVTGLPAGPTRFPLKAVTPESRQKLRTDLREIGLQV